MARRDNSRQQEMHQVIFDGLMACLQEKPYFDISIADICEKAFISRQTFYRYFLNKDNIVHWKTKCLFLDGIGEIGRTFDWEEGFFVTLSGIYAYRPFFSDLQNPEFVAEFIDFASEIEKSIMIETITRYKHVALTPKLEFQIEALAVAQGYMTRRWSIDGMGMPPRAMAEYLSSIVPYDLYHLLKTR